MPKPPRTAWEKGTPGRKPQGPFSNRKSQVTCRLQPHVKQWIQDRANEKGWSFSQEFEYLLDRSLNAKGP